tara:strand:+ start:3172 stop:3486 length:315 start_codon:yes stop_codon:yes gene_type:complete
MVFPTEPTHYIKTALSDLQGAWSNLRVQIIEEFGFKDSEKLIFHIDEAMSWESVRNLDSMKSTLLLIQNIAAQTDLPEEVGFWLNEVRSSLDYVLSEIAEGKVL